MTLVSRRFAFIALVLTVLIASFAYFVSQSAAARPGIVASPQLAEAYRQDLCRPPTRAETLRWDTSPATSGDIHVALATSAEGIRTRAIRQVYLDVVFRDLLADDCDALRALVDSPRTSDDIRRALSATPEAARAWQIRKAFMEALGRDPAGWDVASVRRWMDSSLTPSQVKVRLAAQRPLVGVYYFTWYRRDPSGAWGNGPTQVPSTFAMPLLGAYDSAHLGVMSTHIGEMEQAGLDFVVITLPVNSPAAWTNAHTFFRLLIGRRLKAAVMLDDMYADTAPVKMRWVEKARAEFTSHPNYLRFHGYPLLLTFSAARDFTVSGVTIRNVYWSHAYAQDANTFNPSFDLYPHDWAFWEKTPQQVINGLVPVIPGYVDTHLGRPQSMEYPRRGGQTYHEQWQRALALHPELIIVYSWNEHFEQTAIEPTVAWQDQYLRWTACYAALAHRGTTGRC